MRVILFLSLFVLSFSVNAQRQITPLGIMCDSLGNQYTAGVFSNGTRCCIEFQGSDQILIGDECPTLSKCDVTCEYVQACLYKLDGTKCAGTVEVCFSGKEKSETYFEKGIDITDDIVEWNAGSCHESKVFVKDCFLPDQYAVVWGWAGNGDLTSYDPLTGETTYHCDLGVGGFALAFKNDVTEPTLYFQVAGNLYKASPDDPCGTFSLVGPTAPATSSYPCFAFDPSGRLLLGDGNRVWEVDPATGAAGPPINLIDSRDGANLSVGPGDWFFDPNGKWIMMARDNRGANFNDPDGNPYCTGTAVWCIDPATYVATRLNNSCAPTSGTGATWLASGQYLLSTGAGTVYNHNIYTEDWTVEYNADDNTSGQNTALNDLASQWILPDAIVLCGWKELDCNDSTYCKPTYYELFADEETGEQKCKLYEAALTGKWGVCQKESNPFVSDPSTKDEEFLSDEVWNEGCSDAGFTYWRISYDPAFNRICEYVYGSLSVKDATTAEPENFTPIPCGQVIPGTEIVTPFCNLDNNQTVYRRQETLTDGSIVIEWFDSSGTVPEPSNKIAGACENSDPLLPITQQVVCFQGDNYVREVREIYTPDAEGLPTLQTTQVIYFNEDGILWDSGVVNAGDPFPTGEPTGWYIGPCIFPYDEIENEKLCEFDSEKLLLIDSNGEFAEYDINTKTYEIIPTLSVPSAGSGADPDNFILYAITQGGDLQVVDVNTKTTISQTPLFTNDGSPLTFSAAHFYNGVLYGYDTGGNSLYEIDVNTSEVSFVAGPYLNDGNSGTSLAINPVDGKFYFVSTGGVFREMDPTGLNLVMTVVYDAANNLANGATFDTNGNAYITQSNNTVCISDFGSGNEVETVIVDDFSAGANSMTYYKTEAQTPNCFHRRTGRNTNTGTREVIGDYYLGTDEQRVISGFVNCCECKPDNSTGNGGTGGDVTVNNFPSGFDVNNPDDISDPIVDVLNENQNILEEINKVLQVTIDREVTTICADGGEAILVLEYDFQGNELSRRYEKPNGTIFTPSSFDDCQDGLTITTNDVGVGAAWASVDSDGSFVGENIASIIPINGNSDQDRYAVTFINPMANADYVVTDSKPSDEPNGDERKGQWVAGSKTVNGFEYIMTSDDNGGTEDPQLFHGFDFWVNRKISVVTEIQQN